MGERSLGCLNFIDSKTFYTNKFANFEILCLSLKNDNKNVMLAKHKVDILDFTAFNNNFCTPIY